MLIYIITIFILFCFSLLETNLNLSLTSKRILFFIAYTILVLQVGLRWETGTDWVPYLNNFRLKNVFVAKDIFDKRLEYGYRVFVWVVKLFTNKYSLFLMLHAAIYYYLIFKCFQQYTPFLYVSLMIFYATSMGMMGANRQLIALAICLYSMKFVIQRQALKFFLLILFAMSFHISAAIFSLYYFINRDINGFLIFSVLFITLVLGRLQFPIWLFTFAGKLIGGNTQIKLLLYLQEAKKALETNSLPLIGLLKRIIFFIFFYLSYNKLKESLQYYRLMFNGYVIGLAFYLLFSGSLVIMVSRGSIFFNVMESLLLSSQLYLSQLKGNRIIVTALFFLLAIIFFFQSISSYPEIFIPYKGIFINTGLKRLII